MKWLELGSSMTADAVESGVVATAAGLAVWWVVPALFGLPVDLMAGAAVTGIYGWISYKRKRDNLLKAPPK